MVGGVCGNDNWINSYMDAILDAEKAASSGGGGGGSGGGGGGGDRPSLLLRERGHFSPARYFVEEVITGYDETDLYNTWSRANAMRSLQERNTRLENMTWRIWNLARKKKEEMARRCYVVYIGRVPGVYEEWKYCQKKVNNFSGNNYQGYASREVAEEKWRRHGRKKWRNFLVITTLLLFMVGYVFYFI